MFQSVQFLFNTFELNLGKFSIPVTYWQAGAIVFLIFLLIGGKTVLTSVLGWQNPPAPIAQTLDAGKSKLIQVLGVQTQIPASYAKENVTVQNALQTIQSLAPGDIKSVKNLLCSP